MNLYEVTVAIKLRGALTANTSMVIIAPAAEMAADMVLHEVTYKNSTVIDVKQLMSSDESPISREKLIALLQ